MNENLSPFSEAFIQESLAAGRFSSREKLLDAAIEALRESDKVPMVPDEHMAAVEEGIRDADAGRFVSSNVEEAIQSMYARNAARKGA